ncbi:DUF2383 domain-containing protein [Gangjinia marincola]
MSSEQLQSLIDNNQHIEHQYRHALQFATHKGLKKFLLSQALQRSAFLIELQDQLNSSSYKFEQSKSSVSTTTKNNLTPVYWMNIDKQTLFSSSEVILESFLKGEHNSLVEYTKHLSEKNSNKMLQKILENQKVIINEMLEKVRKLDDL